MNTAVIAEYNPFHNGHALHLEKTRALTGCDNIIVIMSGNFVQRGEPAVFDKHTRTAQALKNGADMVLELPVEYACGAADVFAGAAVGILEKSGIADVLCFGSESGSIADMEAAAELFAHETEEFKALISAFSAEGLSYPAAREAAAAKILKADLSFLSQPNNILGLEYLTAIKRINAKICPFTVKRVQNGYNDKTLSGEISSAAAIRQALLSGSIPKQALPPNTICDYDGSALPVLDGYSDIFAYILRTTPAERLAEIADMTEGLENRFLKYARLKNISDILAAVKTKRYTYTKLQRAVLHCILGITKAAQQAPPAYIRVLGVRKEKLPLLSELTQKSSLPVITRVKDNESLLSREIAAADLYHLLTDGETGSEYSRGMIVGQ